ncbi:dephospho-CoA kinase [Microbacterium sp. APC 3901]|uniref:dephospho-CoA kinase n=1 Tax=Microbacterium sp. APC 3901 TaxID=3035192 RepID=UPI0025B61BF0|nr:dephospho-CoA kinase [Microbacterium sp. APC 3901]MDN3444998.1 dephospho-CoA kinase [Microbacterium sp. APC 3901]
MPLIALTGGIASGKSTIARRLAELGAVIVDADQIVRDVQAPGSAVLSRIEEVFGADVIAEDGALDRAALGAKVFADPEQLARLNAIVHPAVRAESQRRFEAAASADPETVVVYDVPLLVEARVDDPWDLIVVAHAPAGERRRRLVELRGMAEQAAQERIDAQVSDERRLAIADEIVDTSGSLGETIRQTDALWERIRAS